MRLSERLEAIIDMMPPCRAAADIGTDHGFVPIELVRRGIAERAIGCDVRKGPLSSALEHVKRAGLEDKIALRLGDGLSPLLKGEADTVIIAGMGGTLISRILEEGRETAEAFSEMILSPHTDVPLVRLKLQELKFRISAEKMVLEEGKYYVILRAVNSRNSGRGEIFENASEAPSGDFLKEASENGEEAAPTDAMSCLTEDQLLFGPCLLKEKPSVFLRYISEEIRKSGELLEKLRKEEQTEKIGERIFEEEEKLRLLDKILKFSENE